MEMIDQRIARPFIERMRNDPRMRAMVDGWIAQATATVEQRLDHYRHDPRHIASEAAQEALKLALTFILEQDGEYQMVCRERDKLLENALTLANLQPSRFVLKTDTLSTPPEPVGREK